MAQDGVWGDLVVIEFCCVCHEPLIPTTFDQAGKIVAAGLGCPDGHYFKVAGDGILSEGVDGEWFSCHINSPMKEKTVWQELINRAVFKACRRFQKGQPKLAFLK